VNLAVIEPALVSLFQSLAAEDIRWPLVEGTVSWFGRALPFVSPDTQTGIYLRITNLVGYGRPGKRYESVTKTVDILGPTGIVPTSLTVLEHYRDEQRKMTLQVQAVSEDATGLVWVSRIADRMFDPTIQRLLKALGLAVIRVHDAKTFEQVFDDHDQSVASLDIELQVSNTVQGLDALPIEHVTGTGQVAGSTTGTIPAVTNLDIP
jgi:hypothetical protein